MIGVVVPTLNSKNHLEKCLLPWIHSPLKPKVLVIDSSSDDGTVEVARSLGADVIVIPRSEFNHGLTREKARLHLNAEILVMVTADAYAVDASVLEKLIKPIRTKEASIAYARQLPRVGSTFFEAFPRLFNYPAESHKRSIDDLEKYGTFTFFCSDSCAAYSNEALDAIGGFPEVLLGEDTVVAAKLLRLGHHIAYVAEAEVYHSHAYTLLQEFQRYFDTGIARRQHRALIEAPKSDLQRGSSFVRDMMKRLWRERPHLLPYACIQTLAKWLGYQIGQKSTKAPLWWKRLCSSQKYYWEEIR